MYETIKTDFAVIMKVERYRANQGGWRNKMFTYFHDKTLVEVNKKGVIDFDKIIVVTKVGLAKPNLIESLDSDNYKIFWDNAQEYRDRNSGSWFLPSLNQFTYEEVKQKLYNMRKEMKKYSYYCKYRQKTIEVLDWRGD
ncbi:MAG: hypothetical protein ACOCRX_03940 [Candidatus Woesearchaeota archaeon]